jgi:hypothetical protein
MKLVILDHSNTEFTRPLRTFELECRRKTDHEIETISLETKEGDSLALLYGPLNFPAILLIRDDGQLVRSWQGSSLPVIDDVVGYINGP